MRDISLPITIDDIDIGEERRQVNPAAVRRLADSIDQIGLRHPITVRERGERYQLVAGRHRVEAFKKLGREHIPATVVKMTNDEARLWEIAENLHRTDLSKLERDEQIAEWIKITDKVSQVATVSGGRGNEGGVRAAARELGVDKDDAHRAVKVASLSPEAKEAAKDVGLDNRRSALLAAAREATPEAQVAKISELAAAKIPKAPRLADDPLNDLESSEKQVAALMAAWNRAGPEAREEFLLRIDRPVMDRRYAEA